MAKTDSALMLIAGICGVAGTLWGVALLLLGRTLPGLIPIAYSLVTVLGLLHAKLTHRAGFLKYSQLTLILLLPFCLMWALGGFMASGMVMIWGIFAPISALIFFERRTASLWAVAYLVLMTVSVLVDHRVAAWAVPLPRLAEVAFYFLNLAGCPAGIFFLVAHHMDEKKHAIESLRQEQDRLERTRAELADQKAKADELSHMLQTVLDNIPVRIYWKDRDLRFLGCNRLFAQDGGLSSPQDVIGKDDYAMSWHETADLYREDDRRVIESGQARIGFEEPQALKDGGTRWVRISKIPLRDDDGTVFGLLGTYEDITWEKSVKQELIASKESAEAANIAKSTFLAHMSHEIRTPLNAILGLSHILRDEVTDPHQLAWLDRISDSAAHLLGLLTDVLDLSKIEANSLRLEDVDLDIPTLVQGAVDMISEQAREKSLAVVQEVEPGLVGLPLTGDPLRIRQVLINYANNAVKFTERGSIQIRAALQEDRGDRVLVRFEVTDTGIGIPEVSQSRLFNAFEQLEVGTTRKYGGSGLGLAIARRLCEHMGGEAGVTSRPGEGSQFWFTVVLRRGRAEPKPETDREVVSDARVRRGARVLVVEDNEVNQLVARMLLEQMGLVVEVAENGAVALDRVRTADYDLVLMDLAMPVMDGLEATRRIRDLGKTMPIVAMTANALRQEEEKCRAAGMDDFITKPVDPTRFPGILARWIPEPA